MFRYIVKDRPRPTRKNDENKFINDKGGRRDGIIYSRVLVPRCKQAEDKQTRLLPKSAISAQKEAPGCLAVL